MGLAFGEVDLCRFDGAALPSMHESGYGPFRRSRRRNIMSEIEMNGRNTD
jgi:hypothetical protein